MSPGGTRRARVVRPLFGRETRPRLREVLETRPLRLLLAFDLDGTLAPIVRRPSGARIPAARIARLARIASAPNVRAAVVSARRMAEVRRLVPARGLKLVAQYGLEGAGLVPAEERKRARRTATRLIRSARSLLAAVPGAWIEDKGMSLSVHDRGVRAPALPRLRAALAPLTRAARSAGFGVERGRRVTEFLPRGMDKGRALRALRERARPDVVFYFGDSPGDEPAFAALGRDDFGVRVGPGPTSAAYRVRDPEDVDRFLRAVLAARPVPARKRR